MLKKGNILLLFIFCSSIIFGQKRAIVHFYNNDSTLLQEKFFVDAKNILQGEYIGYYSNQNVSKKGVYVNNLPVGNWAFYYQNGVLKSEGSYNNGKTNGYWKYYYENGNLQMEGDLDSNLKQNHWKHYYENGILKNEGTYINSLKEGNWKFFRENGTFKAEAEFKNNEGIYIEYYEDGNINMTGKIVDGKSTGKWKYYYPSGTIKAEGNETNGIKNDLWLFYFESGELKSKGNYNQGVTTGNWNYFHKNGQLEASGNLEGDEKTGYWNMFFPTGEAKAKANYTAPDAKYTEYYESGKIKVLGQFKDGKNDSTWTYFYEDGTKEGICNYNKGNGNFVGYYTNGKIKTEGKLENGKKTGDWLLYDKKGEIVGIYKTLEKDNSGDLQTKNDIINEYNNSTSSKNNKAVLSQKEIRKKKHKIVYPGSKIDNKIILAINPIAPVLGSLPISLEYFKFNKISHQVNFSFLKTPFLSTENAIPLNQIYDNGFSINYRLKNYQKKRENGQPFIAHEARFTVHTHQIKIQDSISVQIILNERETRYEYSLLFGSRNFFKKIDPRFTTEVFLGIGVGYRDMNKNWKNNGEYDGKFSSIDNRKLSIPIRLGFNIGYSFK